MVKKIAVINGPNLNMLGIREPEKYGINTLLQLEQDWINLAQKKGKTILTFQSNHEGEIVNWIHNLYQKCEFIVINPGALTHYSIGLRDALLAVGIPFIEVHLSNIYARESFRHKSVLSDIAIGVISGLGEFGYISAINFAIDYQS